MNWKENVKFLYNRSMDTKALTYYIVVYNQNRTVYGYEGYIILICPLSTSAESGITTWTGPPENVVYFYNDIKKSIY